MEGKVFLTNKEGIRLCAILSNPTEDTNKPVIILCHGHRASKESPTYLKLQEMLKAFQH
jgi:hypothetical protein